MTWRVCLEIAEGFSEIGLHLEAAEALERMPAEDKNRPEVYAMRLLIYVALEKWELAETCAAHLARVWPDQPGWHLAQAAAARNLRGAGAEESVLEEARRRFPEHGEILYGIACAAAQKGDVTRAKVLLATAIGHDDTLKARAIDDPALQPVWGDIENMG